MHINEIKVETMESPSVTRPCEENGSGDVKI